MDKDIKILLVDDEDDFIQPISFWFKSKGYSVRTASNGKDAIELVKQEKPNIIFLDLVMPVMDGVETIKQLRSIDKDIPVVIISAYVDPQKIGEIKPYGISGVFFKGQHFNALIALIESALKAYKKHKD